VGGDQFINAGQTFQRAGLVTDGGDDPFVLTVNYGDGSPPETLTVSGSSPDHFFQLNHVYAAEGSFQVQVSVDDGYGGHDSASFFADVLLPGVPTAPAQEVTVSPGEAAKVSAPGVTVTYAHAADNKGDARVTVATVPRPVAGSLDASFFLDNKQGVSAAYDVRTINAGKSDVAVVTFSYSGDAAALPVLTYFDRASGQYLAIPPSSYVVDTASHTITLLLDSRSTPSLRQLGGTVFTVAIPVTVPVDTALVQQGLVQAAMVLDRRGGSLADSASHEGAQGVAAAAGSFLVSGSKSAVLAVDAAQDVGGFALAEGDLGPQGATAPWGRENGPLRELPAVRAVLTDLPGAPLTPAGFEIEPSQAAPSRKELPLLEAPPAAEPSPTGTKAAEEEVRHSEVTNDKGADTAAEPDLPAAQTRAPGGEESWRGALLLGAGAWLLPERGSKNGGRGVRPARSGSSLRPRRFQEV
jgi:hypothetical protein